MQQAKSPPTDFNEVLGGVVDSMAPLAASLRASLAPLREHREEVRRVLTGEGMLSPLPQDGQYLSIAAIDGAYTVNPLYIGDQINVLALAIRTDLASRELELVGHAASGMFVPHSPTNELLAKITMMASEVRRLGDIEDDGDTLVVVDGSHLTAPMALLSGLLEPESMSYDAVRDEVMSDDFISHLVRLSGSTHVVACPKSDSSTELSSFLATHGVERVRFPDKVLASLILDPGEVLTCPASAPDWTRYDLISRQITGHDAISCRVRIEEALMPLREQGLRVAHIKPPESSTAIRVEVKGGVGAFSAADYWQALSDDCAPPHTQEPVAQYVADYLAKSVSVVAQVQLESARLDMAEGEGDSALLEFMIRNYRS